MKLMRSRFRLIALLFVCIFLLTAVICAASVMKQAGITFPPVQQTLTEYESPSSDTSTADEKETPGPPESSPDGTETPGTDNSPVSEYNLFGL